MFFFFLFFSPFFFFFFFFFSPCRRRSRGDEKSVLLATRLYGKGSTAPARTCALVVRDNEPFARPETARQGQDGQAATASKPTRSRGRLCTRCDPARAGSGAGSSAARRTAVSSRARPSLSNASYRGRSEQPPAVKLTTIRPEVREFCQPIRHDGRCDLAL